MPRGTSQPARSSRLDGSPCQQHGPAPTDTHLVDCLDASQGIIHRLTRVRRQQTNGLVQRFKRRINEVLTQKSPHQGKR